MLETHYLAKIKRCGSTESVTARIFLSRISYVRTYNILHFWSFRDEKIITLANWYSCESWLNVKSVFNSIFIYSQRWVPFPRFLRFYLDEISNLQKLEGVRVKLNFNWVDKIFLNAKIGVVLVSVTVGTISGYTPFQLRFPVFNNSM